MFNRAILPPKNNTLQENAMPEQTSRKNIKQEILKLVGQHDEHSTKLLKWQLCKVYHPDRGNNKNETAKYTSLFQQINEFLSVVEEPKNSFLGRHDISMTVWYTALADNAKNTISYKLSLSVPYIQFPPNILPLLKDIYQLTDDALHEIEQTFLHQLTSFIKHIVNWSTSSWDGDDRFVKKDLCWLLLNKDEEEALSNLLDTMKDLQLQPTFDDFENASRRCCNKLLTFITTNCMDSAYFKASLLKIYLKLASDYNDKSVHNDKKTVHWLLNKDTYHPFVKATLTASVFLVEFLGMVLSTTMFVSLAVIPPIIAASFLLSNIATLFLPGLMSFLAWALLVVALFVSKFVYNVDVLGFFPELLHDAMVKVWDYFDQLIDSLFEADSLFKKDMNGFVTELAMSLYEIDKGLSESGIAHASAASSSRESDGDAEDNHERLSIMSSPWRYA